jgi:hypothetical protein
MEEWEQRELEQRRIEAKRWKFGALHDEGGAIFWNGYEHLNIISLLKSAYAIMEEQPYDPKECPERVCIWERNATGGYDIVWME